MCLSSACTQQALHSTSIKIGRVQSQVRLVWSKSFIRPRKSPKTVGSGFRAAANICCKDVMLKCKLIKVMQTKLFCSPLQQNTPKHIFNQTAANMPITFLLCVRLTKPECIIGNNCKNGWMFRRISFVVTFTSFLTNTWIRIKATVQQTSFRTARPCSQIGKKLSAEFLKSISDNLSSFYQVQKNFFGNCTLQDSSSSGNLRQNVDLPLWWRRIKKQSCRDHHQAYNVSLTGFSSVERFLAAQLL